MNAQQFALMLKRKSEEGSNREVAADGSVSPIRDTGFRFVPKKK